MINRRVALLSLLLLAAPAFSDTGLSFTVTGLTAPAQAATAQAMPTVTGVVWTYPKNGLYVLSYPSVPADATTIAWNDPNLQFREWSSIPATYGIGICTKNIPVGMSGTAVTWTDACASGADKIAKPFIVKSVVALSAAPSPPVVAPPVVAGTDIGITWTAPTLNADGSPLTPITAYSIYRGSSVASLVKFTTLGSTTFAYTDPKLPVGTYFYAITASSVSGESGQSPPVSIAVTAPAPAPGAPGSVSYSCKITTTPAP